MCISRKISTSCIAGSGASTNAGTLEATDTLNITGASYTNSGGVTKAARAHDHAGADRRASRSDDVVEAMNPCEVFRSMLWVVALWMLLLMLILLVQSPVFVQTPPTGAQPVPAGWPIQDPGQQLIGRQREQATQHALAQPDRPAGVAQPELC